MKKKSVGLVLGSGFVRGLAHIGILEVLEKHDIPVGAIAGTSMGALIGGAYCCGNSPAELKEYILHERWGDLVDFTVPKTSIISSIKIKNEIRKLTKGKYFSETRIPLRIVATDMNSREEIIFTRGKVAKAIMASIAVPGIFSPVRFMGRELIDGGLVDPIPIEAMERRNSGIIVVVDISTKPQKKVVIGRAEEDLFVKSLKSRLVSSEVNYFRQALRQRRFIKASFLTVRMMDRLVQRYFNPSSIINYLSKQETPKILKIILTQHDILMNQLVNEKLKNERIDILVKPELEGVTRFEFDKAGYIIKQGEKAAEKAVPKIKRLLKSE